MPQTGFGKLYQIGDMLRLQVAFTDADSVAVDPTTIALTVLEPDATETEYTYANGELEYVVPVTWSKVLPREKAVSELGLFANQNSACKLRDSKTLARLYEVFGLSFETH